MSYNIHFSLPSGSIYLNCAAQGPLSNVATDAVKRSLIDKQFPAVMDQNYGESRTLAARQAIAHLIDWDPEKIALADSTSWGINVIAQGFPFEPKDEVLMVDGQFPSNVAPWDILKDSGVVIKRVDMPDFIFDIEKFKAALTPKTKIVNLEWVHFVSGDRIPLKEICEICHKQGAWVVVDATQGIGAIPFSMREMGVDAVVCSAYKWLVSPYGSGFMALNDNMMKQVCPQIINWLNFENVQWTKNLSSCEFKLCGSAKKYDIFSHMGYLNLDAMTASIRLLTALKPENYYRELRQKLDDFAAALNPEIFEPLNNGPADRQSLISTFKVKHANPEQLVADLKKENIFCSLRNGYLRISPFLYNSADQLQYAASRLNQLSSSGISTTRPSNAEV